MPDLFSVQIILIAVFGLLCAIYQREARKIEERREERSDDWQWPTKED